MDPKDLYSHHTPRSSTSSAIDLTGTPTGLASVPISPSLVPSDSDKVSRRRLSWNRVDAAQDPLQTTLRTTMPTETQDDPFFSPVDEPTRGDYPPVQYPNTHVYADVYSTAQAGPSTASLMTRTDSDGDAGREDDEAYLTANMGRTGGGDDPEQSGGETPRTRRRRTVRYSVSPSPLKRTGTALKVVSHNIRRVSLRVVNVAGAGLENQLRLPDDEEETRRKRLAGEDVQPEVGKRLPLRGRTLGFMGPQNRVRTALYDFLVYQWTEPVILVLIIVNAVVLTVQAFHSSTLPDDTSLPPRIKGYFHQWEDYALFVLFIIFTLEAFARICVSGFLFDPDIPVASLLRSPFSAYADTSAAVAAHHNSASISRQPSLSRPRGPLSPGLSLAQRLNYLVRNIMRPFRLLGNEQLVSGRARSDTTTPIVEKMDARQRARMHIRSASQLTLTMNGPDASPLALPFKLSVTQAHSKIERNVPYLRHSWSRIDFIAIVSFWISFILAETGLERGTHHIGVFRAMSVVRTARLLAITSGTTTIMHSLKTAAPLLTSVAYFVLIAMIIFSIIGIQSFKGSLRRTCYLNPTLGEPEIKLDSQFCGGYVDPVTLLDTGYIQLNGETAASPKGYICPVGQICRQEQENPMGNVASFDTIYYAALQVVIVASANGWSPLMYETIDSEFFISCIFFIVCIVVLNFWLINLFVAVITNTFSAIRSETKKSAFGAAPLVTSADDRDDGWANGQKPVRTNIIKTIYSYTKWCWVLLALTSLAVQATGAVDADGSRQMLIDYGELAITISFDIEIVLRVLAALPDWRSFFDEGQNWLDTVLAIGSSIIQIPAIRHSAAYPWFTIFQLGRFYRVILVVPRMKPLLLAVFGNMYGLANMSLFLLLVNYVAALVAVQLLRGDIPQSATMNFGQLFNAFLGVYQVFSSENWTDVLYGATQAEAQLGQTLVVALFITLWMLFANFIVMQMFIAVINENFSVAEESKEQQATRYWATHQPQEPRDTWTRKLNPYRWIKANPAKLGGENSPDLDLPAQGRGKTRHYPSRSLSALQRLFAGDTKSDDVPLATLRHARGDSVTGDDPNADETERHLDLLATIKSKNKRIEEVDEGLHERRAQEARFIREHPSYDKTFWIFSQKSVLRRLCQKIVQPSSERIYGTPHSYIAHPIFQLIILLSVIGGIAVESTATPIYRHNFYQIHGLVRFSWFDVCETAFGLTLLAEFLIKIIADGFAFTPNAYVRSIWNILDLFILVGLLVNFTTSLIFIGGLSRFTRSLKALRALRLITLIDKMRYTFQSLIISGAIRIVDAAVLAILYMIPYAVWGLNIFAGKMNTCNDDNATGISDCIGEYTNTVVGDSFGFLVPRVWDNPAPSTKFSFDSFKSSLLILFEIVSLEGWIDVMGVATSIVGAGQQPQTNASQVNAIFFLIYNLMGGVVIFTLFISIIIGNFSSQTGSAYLTTAQREWIDLQKLLKRQRPSKRPLIRPKWPLRAWCYDRAVYKHGWWTRLMTFLFILHIIALMTQTFTTQRVADAVRNDFFLAITFIYIIDTTVRFFGLGYESFCANGWNIFDIFVSGGSFITTVVVRTGSTDFLIQQLQKLFLVSIAFKLVQRTNSLNKLFKTAMASLPVILSLLGLWLILFIFFAILYVEIFSMTKWGSGETRNINYSSMGSALVMLAFMSTGEGWNQYMHDYALVYPRCTESSPNQAESDCGSVGWSFTLFILWNLLSMYIFTNMFTGVVVENFSYVFQTSAGGAKSITREEMRSFKKLWGELANPKTGYLERSRFVPFFARLNGAFEVRIYPTECRIPNILANCQDTQDTYPARVVDGVDLYKLERLVQTIDGAAIRKRRATYNRLFHEASVTHQQGRGISFTDMLLMLAHHKLIVDKEALVFNELALRTETNKLVTDLVQLDRVRSTLRMVYHRRNFLTRREERRKLEHDIPSIVVETLPETPMSSRDISSARFESSRSISSPGSPSPLDRRYRHSPDVSLTVDLTGPGLQRSRHVSNVSALSADLGHRRYSMATEEYLEGVPPSPQNSLWSELRLQASEEDEAQ